MTCCICRSVRFFYCHRKKNRIRFFFYHNHFVFQLFTEYGRLAMEEINLKPFQVLTVFNQTTPNVSDAFITVPQQACAYLDLCVLRVSPWCSWSVTGVTLMSTTTVWEEATISWIKDFKWVLDFSSVLWPTAPPHPLLQCLIENVLYQTTVEQVMPPPGWVIYF